MSADPVIIAKPEAPVGRDAEAGAAFKPSLAAKRAAMMASRRRGSTMGSRTTTSRLKEAEYPMFLELAKQCASIDDYWKCFFVTMAAGRFPKGVILRDDCLVYRTAKKTTTFELTPEARSNWQTVANFFRTTCSIRSENDWTIRKQSGEAVVQLTTAMINKRIKKANANAIPEYALTLKEQYSLSLLEMSEVERLLSYFGNANLFRQGDVLYGKNGAIREIKTLLFDPETRRFKMTAEAKAPRYATKESYQGATDYLSRAPFTKPVERAAAFDATIKKQLLSMYAPIVSARAKAAVALAIANGEYSAEATEAADEIAGKKPAPKKPRAKAGTRSRVAMVADPETPRQTAVSVVDEEELEGRPLDILADIVSDHGDDEEFIDPVDEPRRRRRRADGDDDSS